MAVENKFVKHLSKKYSQIGDSRLGGGPVITISREYGCFAVAIAEKVLEKIAAKHGAAKDKRRWSLISKEIIEKSAKELKTDPEKIAHIFDAKEKGFFTDLAQSFIKNFYISDSRILTTIKSVIKSYAWEGNVIIVGRASCAIAQDYQKSLHIKLIAPLEYRIKQISNFLGITIKAAKEQVIAVDEQRNEFLRLFIGKKHEYELYDVILNRAKYDEDYIADLIVRLAEDKKLI